MAMPDPATRFRTLDNSSLDDFVTHLNDATRVRPVVLVTGTTKTDRIPLDPDVVAANVDVVADVYWLPSIATQWDLSGRLNERTFQGAVRVYQPVEPNGHVPSALFSPASHGGLITKIHHNISRAVGLLPVAGNSQEIPPDPAEALRAEADDLAARLAAAEAQLHDMTERVAEANRRAAEARDEARRAAENRGDDGLPQVYADPVEQFRFEVWLTWLMLFPDAERAGWPLRTYVVGPDWIESLDVADRRKILRVTVEVLTRRAADTAGREVRPHHLGAAGTTESLVRAADGARAWRCNLQTNAPQARRLMWWEIPGGTVELAKVALHDDSSMR